MNRIICGDTLEELHKLASNSVDAIVTDPPAGISFMAKEWDTFHVDRHVRAGKEGASPPFVFEHGSTKGERDAFITFMREVMTESLRVMKPGGHALIWSLPRTSHWTASAIEDAGWEIRDCITHIQGQGFPKSLDVSKAIDTLLHADRAVVGTQVIQGNGAYEVGKTHSLYHSSKHAGEVAPTTGKKEIPITLPATVEATQWQGYGTALKPAAEFWWLCRKPLSEKNIAANVLAWGCGGLNIDATRIACTDKTVFPAGQSKATKQTYAQDTYSKTWTSTGDTHTEGRFPSNVLLSHDPRCISRGTKQIEATRGPYPYAQGGDTTPHAYGKYNHRSQVGHSNAQGQEEVEDFECVESCPISIMNEQAHNAKDRYFQQFHEPFDMMTAPFHYFSKASKQEKERGCEVLPFRSPGECTGRKDGSMGLNTPGAGAGRMSGAHNHHPTVKSTQLMRWLCRLVTPTGGTVLDMFSGSGSTCVACVQEGFHSIGIDKSEEYCAIARARVAYEERTR